MRKSDLFEQRVHRIHELLEGSEAVVTWNDHIPDPDDPEEPRQIDVTIKRGKHLTLVECRIHKRRQPKTWIEDLIGRRLSLGAQSVIAVSAMGFSKTATKKASRYGIALRDLRELTDDEVRSWGQSIGLKALTYQYSELTATIWVEDPFDRLLVPRDLAGHPLWLCLFNAAGQYLTDNLMLTKERYGTTVSFGITIEPEGLELAGSQIRLVELTGRAQTVVENIKCPRVEVYREPGVRTAATVERFDLGETSIVHDADRVAIHLDLSALELAPLCQFQGVATEGGVEVDVESFSLVGVEKLGVPRGPITLRVALFADHGRTHPPPPGRNVS